MKKVLAILAIFFISSILLSSAVIYINAPAGQVWQGPSVVYGKSYLIEINDAATGQKIVQVSCDPSKDGTCVTNLGNSLKIETSESAGNGFTNSYYSE